MLACGDLKDFVTVLICYSKTRGFAALSMDSRAHMLLERWARAATTALNSKCLFTSEIIKMIARRYADSCWTAALVIFLKGHSGLVEYFLVLNMTRIDRTCLLGTPTKIQVRSHRQFRKARGCLGHQPRCFNLTCLGSAWIVGIQ